MSAESGQFSSSRDFWLQKDASSSSFHTGSNHAKSNDSNVELPKHTTTDDKKPALRSAQHSTKQKDDKKQKEDNNAPPTAKLVEELRKENTELKAILSAVWEAHGVTPDRYNYNAVAMVKDFIDVTGRAHQEELKRMRDENQKLQLKYDNLVKLGNKDQIIKKRPKMGGTISQNVQAAKLEAEGWTEMQFNEFLDTNRLGRYSKIFQIAHKKKALAHAPSSAVAEHTPQEALMFESHSTKKNVVALVEAPVDQLIELLVLPDNSPLKAFWDYDRFMYQFIIAYQSFLTPLELMQKLTHKFESLQESPHGYDYAVKVSILNIFREWMRVDQGYDFTLPGLLDTYEEFANRTQASEFGTAISQLRIFLKSIQFTSVRKSSQGRAPPPLPPRRIPCGITDVEPLELARQLTVLESNLFTEIKRTEFLHNNWWKEDKRKNAPNLVAAINHANHVASWMTTEILRFPTSKTRAEAVSFFIYVLMSLESLHNYNTMIQVLSSLHSSTICKLKNTWALVGKKEKEIFQRMTKLMSNSHHYRAYHDALRTLGDDEPCIPLLSVICGDLFVVNDTLTDYSSTNPGWVNWSKIEVVADRIAEAKRFEHTCHALAPVQSIQELVLKSECWIDEDICYEIASIRDKDHENANLQYTSTDDMLNYQLSERDWKFLLTGAQEVTFKPGEHVLRMGDVNQHLYRVISGSLNVMRKSGNEMVVVAQLHENQLFGEISMLLRTQKGTITADIVAATECQVYRMQIDLVVDLCQTEPSISAALNLYLAKKLANHLKFANSRAKEVSDAKTQTTTSVSSSSKSTSTRGYKTNKQGTTEADDAGSISEKKSAADQASPALPSSVAGTSAASLGVAPTSGTEAENPDAKFCNRFGLQNEVVARELSCSLKKGKRFVSGILYLSQNFICFAAATFGFKVKEVIPIRRIVEVILEKKKKKAIHIRTSDRLLVFCQFKSTSEAFGIINGVWSSKTSQQLPTASSDPDILFIRDALSGKNFSKKMKKKTATLKPTDDDWQLILKGSKQVKYHKGEHVMTEGQRFQQIFQISRGRCRIEKEGHDRILGYIGPDDGVFGEISFLEAGIATASVIADEDTTISIIEAYFLNVIFQHYPILAGRFFHYIAYVIARRITARELGQEKLPRAGRRQVDEELVSSEENKDTPDGDDTEEEEEDTTAGTTEATENTSGSAGGRRVRNKARSPVAGVLLLHGAQKKKRISIYAAVDADSEGSESDSGSVSAKNRLAKLQQRLQIPSTQHWSTTDSSADGNSGSRLTPASDREVVSTATESVDRSISSIPGEESKDLARAASSLETQENKSLPPYKLEKRVADKRNEITPDDLEQLTDELISTPIARAKQPVVATAEPSNSNGSTNDDTTKRQPDKNVTPPGESQQPSLEIDKKPERRQSKSKATASVSSTPKLASRSNSKKKTTAANTSASSVSSASTSSTAKVSSQRGKTSASTASTTEEQVQSGMDDDSTTTGSLTTTDSSNSVLPPLSPTGSPSNNSSQVSSIKKKRADRSHSVAMTPITKRISKSAVSSSKLPRTVKTDAPSESRKPRDNERSTSLENHGLDSPKPRTGAKNTARKDGEKEDSTTQTTLTTSSTPAPTTTSHTSKSTRPNSSPPLNEIATETPQDSPVSPTSKKHSTDTAEGQSDGSRTPKKPKRTKKEVVRSTSNSRKTKISTEIATAASLTSDSVPQITTQSSPQTPDSSKGKRKRVKKSEEKAEFRRSRTFGSIPGVPHKTKQATSGSLDLTETPNSPTSNGSTHTDT